MIGSEDARALPRPKASYPCGPRTALARLGDKWVILVVLRLADAPDGHLRFNEIRRSIDGISQRMLTVTLRMLERNGLLDRSYFAEIPPKVEYRLNEAGRSMARQLEGFVQWAEEHWPAMEEARTRYDAGGER